MFKFAVVFAACLVYAAATPGLVHPTAFAAAPAAIAYANAPLYAAGGSQQIDVRHNYDGTLSSYTTTPFGYTSPISSRYVAGAPALPAAYAAAPAAFAAGPAAFATAPAAYAAAPAAFASYAAPAKLVAPAGIASPYAVASPYGFPFASGFAGPLSNPYAAAAPARVVV